VSDFSLDRRLSKNLPREARREEGIVVANYFGCIIAVLAHVAD